VAGSVVVDLLPPPPQPVIASRPTPMTAIRSRDQLRLRRRPKANSAMLPRSPKGRTAAASMLVARSSEDVVVTKALKTTATVAEELPLASVSMEPALQFELAGAPVQARVKDWLAPPVMVSMEPTVDPCATEALVGDRERVKSAVPVVMAMATPVDVEEEKVAEPP
jgi:hypothetical protein